MPRRLIILVLVILIIGVVGGLAVVVVSRLQSGDTTDSQRAQLPGQLQLSEPGSQQVVDPTGDDDNDGLPNAEEALWGTSRSNPDTDGDGFSDGEEVANRRNPTIPSPNDQLPEGFEPGRDLTPLASAPSSGVAVDEFFERNLDLDLASKNYTDEYRAQFSGDRRTTETLTQYVQNQEIVTKLPTPLTRAVQLESQDSRTLLLQYLEVGGDLRAFSNIDAVEASVDEVIATGDAASVLGLALQVRLYQERLLETPVPPAAESLHRLLLGYSELTAATYDVIAVYPEDPVKSAVGMYQLEVNDQTYVPIIVQEVERLEQLAGQG